MILVPPWTYLVAGNGQPQDHFRFIFLEEKDHQSINLRVLDRIQLQWQILGVLISSVTLIVIRRSFWGD